MNKIRDAASFLKKKFETDQLDQKLAEAVSEQNWQASTQLLHEIANASYNFEKESKILAFIYDKIKNKSWKKILKTLHLVDFLLKYGPTTLIENLKENIYEFRQLDDFKHHSEGIDRGESIRKQSKAIVVLLSDEHLLNDERAKAKQIKERMANVIGSGAYYGNFSSDTKTTGSNFDNKNVGGYANISSDSYKYSGSISGGGNGTSFGQSVMKQLQEKKKKEQPFQEKKPNPPKLNLSSMNERKAQKKAEEQKANFSNLSQKLVKPPEKKPSFQPKTQTSNPPPKLNIQGPQKTQPKGKNNFDIMDLDFQAMGVNQTAKPNQAQTFDFLGSSQTQKTQTFNLFQQKNTSLNPSVSPKPQLVENNFLLEQPALLLNSSPPQKLQPQQPLPSVQAPFYPQQYQINNNFGGLNGLTLGNYQNINTNVAPSINQPAKPQGNNNFALNLNTGQKKQNKGSDSLIDFSNFREQLNGISGNDKKESITTNWNW